MLRKFKDEFVRIRECEDVEVRNYGLGRLMIDMEKQYGIQIENMRKFDDPVIAALYKDICEERLAAAKKIYSR